MYKLLSIILILFSFSANAQVSAPKDAGNYIELLGNSTLVIVTSTATEVEKESKLTSLFQQAIDTDWIGKFVLGRYWRIATPEQQNTFLIVYKKYLIQNYVPYFKNYTGEKFSVVSVKPMGDDADLVSTNILHADGHVTRVDYRVTNLGNNTFVIRDIVVEGVSLITAGRDEFGSVISRVGIDGLIEMIKNKTN